MVSRVITLGLELVGRQTGLVPRVNSCVPATLSDTGISSVISNLGYPDLGTSVQPSLGSVFRDQHARCSMNGRVAWLQRVDDRIFQSFASDTIAEVRRLVLGAEELKPQSTDVGRGLDVLTSHEKRLMLSLILTFLQQTKMWKRACWISFGTVMIDVTVSGATCFGRIRSFL